MYFLAYDCCNQLLQFFPSVLNSAGSTSRATKRVLYGYWAWSGLDRKTHTTHTTHHTTDRTSRATEDEEFGTLCAYARRMRNTNTNFVEYTTALLMRAPSKHTLP